MFFYNTCSSIHCAAFYLGRLIFYHNSRLSIFLLFTLVISKEKWEKMMSSNGWNSVELRDNRYNQIIHMVTAANGAEDFYTTEVIIIFYTLRIHIIKHHKRLIFVHY